MAEGSFTNGLLFIQSCPHNEFSQFSSVAQSCLTFCDSMEQHTRLPCPSPTPRNCSNSCPSRQEAIQPSHPLSYPSPLPSIFPSIRVFSNEKVLCIRWPTYWSFGFSISPSNEYSGLISFRMDWLDLLAVQETPKSPLDCKEIQPVHPKGDQS